MYDDDDWSETKDETEFEEKDTHTFHMNSTARVSGITIEVSTGYRDITKNPEAEIARFVGNAIMQSYDPKKFMEELRKHLVEDV